MLDYKKLFDAFVWIYMIGIFPIFALTARYESIFFVIGVLLFLFWFVFRFVWGSVIGFKQRHD